MLIELGYNIPIEYLPQEENQSNEENEQFEDLSQIVSSRTFHRQMPVPITEMSSYKQAMREQEKNKENIQNQQWAKTL